MARRGDKKERWNLSGPEAYPESSDAYAFASSPAPGAAAYAVPHNPTPIRADAYYNNNHQEEAPFEQAAGDVESMHASTPLTASQAQESPRNSVQQVWGSAGAGVAGVRQPSIGTNDNTVRWRGTSVMHPPLP